MAVIETSNLTRYTANFGSDKCAGASAGLTDAPAKGMRPDAGDVLNWRLL
jgi:hypothetical protein